MLNYTAKERRAKVKAMDEYDRDKYEELQFEVKITKEGMRGAGLSAKQAARDYIADLEREMNELLGS